jgi:glycosyltransferase involved in cell wall biosynthesis
MIFSKKIIKLLFQRSVYFIDRYPQLRLYSVAIVKALGLHTTVRSFYRHLSNIFRQNALQDLDNISPRTHQIYINLENAIKTHKQQNNPIPTANENININDPVTKKCFLKEINNLCRPDLPASSSGESLQAFIKQQQQKISSSSLTENLPKLAFVSPLPPAQSGIAVYSAELLQALSIHYDITVIVDQEEVSDSWIVANKPIHDVNWFKMNAPSFDRVLYHFGNSVFHIHMFDLLNEIPGVIVLHDFFISNIIEYMEANELKNHSLAKSLFYSHGVPAIYSQNKDNINLTKKYPCNLEILQKAFGIIIHSEHSKKLVEKWYGKDLADNLSIIPLLRSPAQTDRQTARQKLNIPLDDFVVCSFGHLSSSKLTIRIIKAWMNSPIFENCQCHLVFVGSKSYYEPAEELDDILMDIPEDRIKITNWVDTEQYKLWLGAADVGVQLRAKSRGETSAAVLDCMNHGLATIVNAHGSMAELPKDAVLMLADNFSNESLINALKKLWENNDYRTKLSEQASNFIRTQHAPRKCAVQYAKAIEFHYQQTARQLPTIIDYAASILSSFSTQDKIILSNSLANNFPVRMYQKRIFLDVSELVKQDLKTGIQRVVRSVLLEFISNPPPGWRIEPIYATIHSPCYYYAYNFISKFLNIDNNFGKDRAIDIYPGDIFLGLSFQASIIDAQKEYLLKLHQRGIKIFFVVYDLLIKRFPHFFPDTKTGATQKAFSHWLENISCFDGVICISQAVADDFVEWFKGHTLNQLSAFEINWFHLGADFDNFASTTGLPENAAEFLKKINSKITFLMVGTLEPRKSHAQVLDAFDILWGKGVDLNLVIVGKQGWMIKALLKRLRTHPERNKRMFWLKGVSDEYLGEIYAESSCLIAASEDEGFGLPLIEAAQNKLSIIARDIPVFREVAGEYAFYFSGNEEPALAEALEQWLELFRQGKAPKSDDMPWLTWRESAEQLCQCISGEKKYL